MFSNVITNENFKRILLFQKFFLQNVLFIFMLSTSFFSTLSVLFFSYRLYSSLCYIFTDLIHISLIKYDVWSTKPHYKIWHPQWHIHTQQSGLDSATQLPMSLHLSYLYGAQAWNTCSIMHFWVISAHVQCMNASVAQIVIYIDLLTYHLQESLNGLTKLNQLSLSTLFN